jgi:hypothetical protein
VFEWAKLLSSKSFETLSILFLRVRKYSYFNDERGRARFDFLNFIVIESFLIVYFLGFFMTFDFRSRKNFFFNLKERIKRKFLLFHLLILQNFFIISGFIFYIFFCLVILIYIFKFTDYHLIYYNKEKVVTLYFTILAGFSVFFNLYTILLKGIIIFPSFYLSSEELNRKLIFLKNKEKRKYYLSNLIAFLLLFSLIVFIKLGLSVLLKIRIRIFSYSNYQNFIFFRRILLRILTDIGILFLFFIPKNTKVKRNKFFFKIFLGRILFVPLFLFGGKVVLTILFH